MSESHYEKRLEEDLARIRASVKHVAASVEIALKNALQALLQLDKNLASRTILGDMPINRATKRIDRLCHAFVARHLPSAGHLRFISSVIRVNLELERIGDYAVTICRETVQLSAPLDATVQRETERLAKDTLQMFHQALEAFLEGNVELARATLGYSDQIDRGFDQAFEDLVHEGQEKKRSVRDLFGTLVIFNRFERVSDQAKNVCEETVFAVVGEEKAPKVYRVLFVDDGDGVRARLAVAVARKAYPVGGQYESAAAEPQKTLSPALSRFVEARSLDVQYVDTRSIDETRREWGDFHVIVSVSGPVRSLVDNVPFRTVTLDWSPPPLPDDGASEDDAQAQFDEVYREIAHDVRDLMETLRGEEAS